MSLSAIRMWTHAGRGSLSLGSTERRPWDKGFGASCSFGRWPQGAWERGLGKRDEEGGKTSKGCINPFITALATGAQPFWDPLRSPVKPAPEISYLEIKTKTNTNTNKQKTREFVPNSCPLLASDCPEGVDPLAHPGSRVHRLNKLPGPKKSLQGEKQGYAHGPPEGEWSTTVAGRSKDREGGGRDEHQQHRP